MKRPVPTPLAAALLLAFSGHAWAVDVASEADYIDAITGGNSEITILNDITFTGAIPNAVVVNGFVLQGQSGQNTTLTGNATSGALRIGVTAVTSAIRDLTFQNFLTTDSLRGVAYSGKLLGSISNTKFVNNTATSSGGGAIYLSPDSSVTVDGGTRFVGNEAGRGAGIYATGITSLHIKDTTFIGNRAVGTAAQIGYGGAVAAWGNDIFMGNITVLGNTGKDAGNGCNVACAAAIVHGNDDVDPASVVFSATNGKDTRIYGNRATDTEAYRALYLGYAIGNTDPTITHLTFTADAASRLLLLDGLKDEHFDLLTVNLKKEGAGTWYQGGVSEMGSRNIWNLDAGTLALTTVTYDGINDVAARINLTSANTATFNLNSGATLAGSGTIQAKDITLSGILDPDVYRNTGLNAVDMAAAIAANGDLSQAQIDSIGVNQTSSYGTLAFGNNVTMTGAVYNVDIDVDTNQQDVLDIAGSLNVTGASTLNIASLTYASPPAIGNDGQLYTVASGVIKTTGGITGDNLLSVTGGGANLTGGADFLDVYGVKNGNNYDLNVGLAWYSNRVTGGQKDAHGDFDVATAFTLNGALVDQTQHAGNPTARGWEGNSLTKKGAGTLTLNGVNTYTGLTSVDAGTLNIGALGSIAGNVAVAANSTLGGAGSIAGNATVAGLLTDTLTIGGNVNVNNGGQIAGASTINGNLNLAAGAILAGTGTVNGTSDLRGFITPNGDGGYGTLAFGNNVTMTGAVYNVDIDVDTNQQDVLDIAGSLNVTGPTTININTLTYTDPAIPDHSQDFYTVMSEVIKTTGGITGAGNIAVTATGVDLTGKGYLQGRGQVDSTGNNYDLYLGLRWRSNRVDDASGDHDAHGFFDIAAGNTFTLNSDLKDRTDALFAGTGNAHGWDGTSLIKTGDGTLVLGGNNSYTGGTTVDAGALEIAGTTQGLVDVNNSAHVLVSGTLLGNANVNHDATLTVNGTLQGTATVASGATLTGTGSLAGDVSVAGFLRGTKTIQGHVTMLAGSTVAPGFSIGTLQAAQYTFNPDSTYAVEINEAGLSDVIDVHSNYGVGDGTVTIGNNVTLRVLADATATTNPVLWQPDTPYDIITSENGVTGQFSNVINTLAFLKASVDYDTDPNKVTLRMARNNAQFGTGGGFCTQSNQCTTGNGLDALETANGNHPLILALWQLGAGQIPAALENLSGEIYGSMHSALLRDRHLGNTMMRRAQVQAHVSAGSTLWAEPWAQNGKIRGDANTAQVDVSGTGLALGVDHAFTPNAMTGAFLAYEDSKVKNGSTRNSRSDIDGYSAGVYAAAQTGRVQLRGGMAYSRLDMATRRAIAVGIIQGPVQSKTKGRKVQAFAEAALPFAVSDRVTLAPYAGLTQAWLRTNAARETGNAAALDIARQTDSTHFATLGVRANLALPTVRPAHVTFDAGWIRAFGDTQGQIQHSFAGTNAGFSPKGVAVGKNAALAGVGVHAQLSDTAALNLGYQGQFGSGNTDHSANLQVRVRF